MPTILRKHGYRFHFYSNEGTEPPHIHATGNGGEMKVWLSDLSIGFSFGLNAAEQRKILDVVVTNKTLFEEKWNEFAGRKN